MSTDESLSPARQALLDELYWNSTRTLKSIADEMGLVSPRMTKLITPLPAGLDCWLCGRAVTFRSRSARDDNRKYRHNVQCLCGADQPQLQERAGLVDSLATILLTEPPDRLGRRRNAWPSDATTFISTMLCHGVLAMDSCRLRWSGRFLRVDDLSDPRRTRDLLDALPSREVVIPTLRDLAMNDGDSLALYFNLIADGWRVITSARTRYESTWEASGWYDELASSWERDRLFEDGSMQSRISLRFGGSRDVSWTGRSS